MLRYLWCVQIAVVVIALGLIAYPWRDKPAKRRFGVVAFVGFGVGFGIQALEYYLARTPMWVVWLCAAWAVALPAFGFWSRRSE
jgi:uncharacterized membrane protein YhhN